MRRMKGMRRKRRRMRRMRRRIGEDKEVVLAAVAQDGFAPIYADERLCRLLSQELQA